MMMCGGGGGGAGGGDVSGTGPAPPPPAAARVAAAAAAPVVPSVAVPPRRAPQEPALTEIPTTSAGLMSALVRLQRAAGTASAARVSGVVGTASPPARGLARAQASGSSMARSCCSPRCWSRVSRSHWRTARSRRVAPCLHTCAPCPCRCCVGRVASRDPLMWHRRLQPNSRWRCWTGGWALMRRSGRQSRRRRGGGCARAASRMRRARRFGPSRLAEVDRCSSGEGINALLFESQGVRFAMGHLESSAQCACKLLLITSAMDCRTGVRHHSDSHTQQPPARCFHYRQHAGLCNACAR